MFMLRVCICVEFLCLMKLTVFGETAEAINGLQISNKVFLVLIIITLYFNTVGELSDLWSFIEQTNRCTEIENTTILRRAEFYK